MEAPPLGGSLPNSSNVAPTTRDRVKQELVGYNLDDIYNAYVAVPCDLV